MAKVPEAEPANYRAHVAREKKRKENIIKAKKKQKENAREKARYKSPPPEEKIPEMTVPYQSLAQQVHEYKLKLPSQDYMNRFKTNSRKICLDLTKKHLPPVVQMTAWLHLGLSYLRDDELKAYFCLSCAGGHQEELRRLNPHLLAGDLKFLDGYGEMIEKEMRAVFLRVRNGFEEDIAEDTRLAGSESDTDGSSEE